MEPLAATYYNSDEKTWYGPNCKPLYSDAITLGEVIYDKLKKNPNKIIQIHDVTGEKLTCSELLQYAEALGQNLMRMGLIPGDIIGLYANNWTHVVTIMLASFLCGTPVNALYPGYDKESALLIFNITKPKIIFCEIDNYENAQSLAENLNLKNPVFILNGEEEGVPHIGDLLKYEINVKEEESFRFPCLDLKGDDTAFIACSSGTTGTPKAALSSNRALLNQRLYLTLTNESVLFTFSTMYWASGPWTLISSLINGAVRIITTRPYTPEYFLYLVRKYKISHLMTADTPMAELILAKNIASEEIQEALQSIDTMIVAGAKIHLIIQEKMNAILANNKKRPGFSVTYGMSELAGILSTNSSCFMKRSEGTEGQLVANCEVRIISKEGHRLGPLERGEICIRTPYKWKGYLNNPEATRKAQRNDWLYTGDIGYFDEEGYLHFCARDNDVFKSRGFQIFPPIIEDVVLRLSGIAECCVFGIADFVAANLIGCVVVKAQSEDGINLTAEKIHSHIKLNMGPNYYLSGGIYFVDSIPKTGSGKLRRNEVLQMVMQKGGKMERQFKGNLKENMNTKNKEKAK